MKFLISGAAGFIGCNLARHLVKTAGHQVIGIDKLTYAGNLNSLDDLVDSSDFTFVKADICDSDTISSLLEQHQPDGVLHLAAESHVDRSIDGPDEFIQTNIVGTYRMLQCSRAYFDSLAGSKRDAFRFLHVSTDEVYGSLELESPAFTETNRYDPHSPYSASKASSDHLVRAWNDTFGLPTLITNCSNNYGPYQFPEKLIPVVVLKALRGDSIPVYGTGENIRDWLYVDDHAKAIEAVFLRGRVGQTYNVGGDNEMTNIDLVRLICTHLDEFAPIDANPALSKKGNEITSYADLITFVTDRPGHDLRYAIDSTKIRDQVGWQPVENKETGLAKTVRWYLNNDQWCQQIFSGDYQLSRRGLS